MKDEISRLKDELAIFQYDPEYGDDRECQCGHPYYRHFDSYEDMSHVGCKYCECYNFNEVQTKEGEVG